MNLIYIYFSKRGGVGYWREVLVTRNRLLLAFYKYFPNFWSKGERMVMFAKDVINNILKD